MRAADAGAPSGLVRLGSDKDGGTLFCRDDDPRARKGQGRRRKQQTQQQKKTAEPAPQASPAQSQEPSLDWAAEAQRSVAALPAEKLEGLARSLGVTPGSLVAIGAGWASSENLRKWKAGGDGWTGKDYPRGAFTFIERGGDGSIVGLSLRAEDGRKGAPNGKVGARRGLIVSSTLAERPDPVLIVEGASDVAALESLGIAAVGRPSNSAGSTDLALLLRGRQCIVIGENDRRESGKWPGREGARSVAADLGGEWGTTVPFALPPDGAKDVRAWLRKQVAAGLNMSDPTQVAQAAKQLADHFIQTAEREDLASDVQARMGHPYKFTDHGIVIEKHIDGGIVEVSLTNFTARIVADVSRDDGAERRRVFTIEGRIGSGPTIVFDVPAERFASMNWPVEHMGVSAIVMPGMGAKDHARTAIQHFSDGCRVCTVFLHLGWVKIGWKHVYLHAKGGIGETGVIEGVEVDAPPDLANYVLPPPPSGHELADAVRESLKIVNLGPRRITIPLLAAMFRSAIDSCEFAVHVEGFTGAFKSSLVGVYLSFFGAAFDDKHLPASWASTDNALEGLAFAAKNVPFAIDDFAPTGSSIDQSRLHAKADRILRGAGNRQGRARMRADTSFRPAKFPRGLIISTGEDIPSGQSLRARMLIVSITRGEISRDRLSVAQASAALGTHALAMSGFIRWLAPRLDQVREKLRERVRELRNAATDTLGHRQTAVITAEIRAGFEVLLDFATGCDAISKQEAEGLAARAIGAMDEAAQAQSAHQRDSDPVPRFFSLLASAVASGAAHVASAASTIEEPDDERPSCPEAWGWRAVQLGGNTSRTDWRSSGERIGWTDGESLYLDRDAALKAANKAAGDSPIPLSATTLAKRLWERRFICRRESSDHLTVQVALHGSRKRVLHLRADTLVGPGKPGNPESDDAAEAPNAVPSPVSCPGSEDEPEETGARDRGDSASEDDSAGQHHVDAPDAPVSPVSANGWTSGSGQHAKPGPPGTCFGCKKVRWFTTAANGGKDWQRAACHPPIDDADIVWWKGNDGNSA